MIKFVEFGGRCHIAITNCRGGGGGSVSDGGGGGSGMAPRSSLVITISILGVSFDRSLIQLLKALNFRQRSQKNEFLAIR